MLENAANALTREPAVANVLRAAPADALAELVARQIESPDALVESELVAVLAERGAAPELRASITELASRFERFAAEDPSFPEQAARLRAALT